LTTSAFRPADQADQRRLDPRARGAVDQHGPVVSVPKTGRYSAITCSYSRSFPGRTGPADRRSSRAARAVGIDRPRPHQQALGRVDFAKKQRIKHRHAPNFR
jgi:hypothetical protein